MSFKARRDNTEHRIQAELIDYLYIAGRRDLHWFAIPNGGHRHIRQGEALKAEGVRRGTPDLCFMLPNGRVGWLEMKAPKGSLSKEQKAFRDLAQTLGHHWAMARSVDEAIVELSKWGVLRSAHARSNPLFSTRHLDTIKLNPAKEQAYGT